MQTLETGSRKGGDEGIPNDRDGAADARGPAARIVRGVLSIIGDPRIEVILPDGARIRRHEAIVGTLRIHDRKLPLRLLRHPELAFGEGYMHGGLTVEGDLARVIEECSRCMRRAPAFLRSRRLRRLIPTRSNSEGRSKHHVEQHYDLGNDFYRLWLDERMVYTCAYFPTPDATLEAAQVAKLDHVARKLWLSPGERVVEAGCGWGALALHLAEHYGVHVTAYNISREQLAWARERAAERGLEGRVRFVEGDYRSIDGRYDAFVSVGMLEHVGAQHYPRLGEVMDRCLTDQGRALVHSIGRDEARRVNDWTRKYIFPGGHVPTLREMMDVFEPTGRFSVLDVENLRRHYALTVEHWRERFLGNVDRVREDFDETFVRMWTLYLNASIAAFASGDFQLFQVVAARPGVSSTPWHRGYLYGS